ncbi:MAG: DUF429 domain-containing protein, partial [Methylocapsa sp.]|nr:DUF429 domain-containing protein [Methylocapsa sp.]
AVCAIAQETSDPPRKPSKEAFGIFSRIRQIDEFLRQEPALRECVFEVHPEVSFRLMNFKNNDGPLPTKKSEQGLRLRRELLMDHGFGASFLGINLPRGVALDDFYDACACAWTAKRILVGIARIFPCNPPSDIEGLEQAIRA